MNKFLSQYISIYRRYSRSINLERDFDDPDALNGYILTERSIAALKRIMQGIQGQDGNNAWTLTSVYGTGKSAFAHYVSSVVANNQAKVKVKALEIARITFGEKNQDYQNLTRSIPSQGYIRAVATAQREPISHTVIRALHKGIKSDWEFSETNQPLSINRLVNLEKQIREGNRVTSEEVSNLIPDLSNTIKKGIVIIIDELGKTLEYAAHHRGAEDLYLLQKLSELPKNQENPIYILGILHQSFAEYSQRLASVERNEWSKIQGRFEDIPFTESPMAMMRLIGQAVDKTKAEAFHCAIHNTASEWFSTLKKTISGEEIGLKTIFDVYPLHPIAALILPTLCQRYAQNDRTLFTFLTSREPFSLRNFLDETLIDNDPFPTVKLDRIYDYFVEATGIGLTSRPNLQRWVEIQDLINDSRYLDDDSLRVLKAIAILNLNSTIGMLRATRDLVILALCDSPCDNELKEYWNEIINQLLNRGIITHFKQLDELRIWQGSDFNVDKELNNFIEQENRTLAELLSGLRPLEPIIAQKHSYKTGTLRYFERIYLDDNQALQTVKMKDQASDGLIIYWLGDTLPNKIPDVTNEGTPILLIKGQQLDLLRIRSREYAGLKNIQITSPELKNDGVARKEVRYRLSETEKLLDDLLISAFELAISSNYCWVQGNKELLHSVTNFNSILSQVCDNIYHKTPILWNELINRRELTSQGSKARRQLITAMLENQDKEMLGLSGYGPEVSIYYSLLKKTGIHTQILDEENKWEISVPPSSSQIYSFWETIETFCITAKDKPQNLEKLYTQLSKPPYGIKQGSIPIMIAAVLLFHSDDVGVYQEGTFIPILGPEHFELLLKDPSRFSVKNFEVIGLRSEVFKQLESILIKRNFRAKIRNTTLLSIVTPLYQFVKNLPTYTKQTRNLTQESVNVLQALQETIEPDELIFTKLPIACGLAAIGVNDNCDSEVANQLKINLMKVLREINTAYDNLLSDCQKLIYDAFGISKEHTKLREDLKIRARNLMGKCVERNLRSFIQIAIDEDKSDKEWLEALIMVISDKPPESWTDGNIPEFQLRLSNLTRKFNNLEVLQNDISLQKDQFEARKITLTHPDGEEAHQMVWLDNSKEEEIEKYVQDILPRFPDSQRMKQMVLTKLTEILLKGD